MGIGVLKVPADAAGRVDLEKLLPLLAQRQISSVLVEGGAEVITAFLKAGLADRLVVFIAPRIMGKGIEAVGELDIAEVARAIKISYERVYRSGEDIVVEGRVGG
jgi:diaminohydroxyphosphoribosylaminopyrimidine deaminase/5-amino-6-(5-phosphoribosylamino)uracil reductase